MSIQMNHTKEMMIDAYTKAVGFAPATVPYWLHAFADNLLAASDRDAERYRWIRDVLRLDDVRWMNVANWNQTNISADIWDSEIDAAMAQQPPGDAPA